jgi:hypothetical protein
MTFSYLPRRRIGPDFFANAQHFVVSGGHFTNNVTHTHNEDAATPSGDAPVPIDPQNLMHLQASGRSLWETWSC